MWAIFLEFWSSVGQVSRSVLNKGGGVSWILMGLMKMKAPLVSQ